MKAKTKKNIGMAVIIPLIGFGVAGYVHSWINASQIQKLKKENIENWTDIVRMDGEISRIRNLQQKQGEVVIQIADKINRAIVVGIKDKKVFEEMKRREAYIAE